jgi:hypothetical protein
MYFNTKNYLKNTRNHTANQAFNLQGLFFGSGTSEYVL